MKKTIFLLISVLSLGTIKAQTSNDTLMIDGEIIGTLNQVKTDQNQEGQSVLTFDVSLYRDVTKKEEKLIMMKYNPGGSLNRNVDLSYNYNHSSNQALAGHLLYDAGKLKTQSNNMYLTAGLVALTGSMVTNYMVKQGNVSTLVPRITLSTTTIISIVGLVKDYKANRKIREAGVLLQKK
jgi:hypothetical protein